MNRNVILALLGIALILLGIRTLTQNEPEETPMVNTPDTELQTNQEEEVERVVTEFGESLRDVSVLSPTAADDIEENYSKYVSEELLETWRADPENAPGRLTSSPWPERIEIESTTQVSDTEYFISGNIVELENSEGGDTLKGAILITIERIGDSWLITDLAKIESFE